MGVVGLNTFRDEVEEVCTTEKKDDGDGGEDEDENVYKIPVFQGMLQFLERGFGVGKSGQDCFEFFHGEVAEVEESESAEDAEKEVEEGN